MITLVVAVSENGVIGKGGGLPWHMPADLRFFREVTAHYPMIMGRKTRESLPGLLPDREHIILTRQSDYQAPGATLASSLEEALQSCGPRVSVIGGTAVFNP